MNKHDPQCSTLLAGLIALGWVTLGAAQPDESQDAAATVAAFTEFIRQGEPDSAKRLFATTPEYDDEAITWLVEFLVAEQDAGNIYHRVLSSREFDDAAVVLIETGQRPVKHGFEIVPLYLRMQNGQWKLLPSLGAHVDPGLGVSEKRIVQFDVLAEWAHGKASTLTAVRVIERGVEYAMGVAQQEKAIEDLERRFGGVTWGGGWIVALHLKNEEVTDDDLRVIESLPHLRSLTLSDTPVTDATLRSAAQTTDLRALYLSRTAVTDDGLKHIANLRRLDNLWLHGTDVTDEGVASLRNLTKMGYLDLGNTGVTDACLQDLVEMTELYYLHVPGTQVTEEGLRWLTSRLPRLRAYNGSVTVEGKELGTPPDAGGAPSAP